MKFLICIFSFFTSIIYGVNSHWLATGGIGLTVSPTLLLINGQLEYRHNSQLYYGPLVQMGLGDIFPLFSISGSIRYVIKTEQKIKPSLEGGIGIAIADGLKTNVGAHIMMGMGFDYIIDKHFSLGTMVRANFAPPMDTFFLSWPIMLARLQL